MPSPNNKRISLPWSEEVDPIHPPEIWDSEIEEDEPKGGARAFLARVNHLSPAQQLGYGCLVIVIFSAALVYCVGAATFFIRPMIAERAAVTPTPVVHATLAPTPTQQTLPALIQQPAITLVATPTQAPIPSREPMTATSLPEMVNGMTVTPSINARSSPTRKPSPSLTPRP